ncbi:secretin N-terminal domain-containing protein [Fuerstiella marisgermanici]|uniref:Phage assembly protein n=1 Tax=Fuerstiella marisgermanici TaxID=1891926 RepID=A0A1P8WLI4_9PLAN|nr:secretin N-terminal domain-containing protein [Fuerstiella marisgermanici]APZ94910.1 phage assembly protein [Fuerstiella marisgermanici]
MFIKFMSVAFVGCLTVLAQETSSQTESFKRPDNKAALTPIRPMVAPLLEADENSQEGDSKVKRELHVAVALVQKDWTEAINNNAPVLEELKQLYEGVDMSALGGELPDVAPELILPESRVAVFSYADYAKLIVRLRDLKLIESVKTEPVEDSEQEEFGPYSFERVEVSGLKVVPEGKVVPKSSLRPFTREAGSWSIGVGTDIRNQNSVICDPKYIRFIETDWPTSSELVDRQPLWSNHFGSRFDLLPGKVAVLRWSSEGQMRAGAGGTGRGGFRASNGDGAKDDTTFPIIVILNGDELPAPNIAHVGWSKPLKTIAPSRFDYNATSTSIRREESKNRTFPKLSSASAGSVFQNNENDSTPPERLTKVFRLQQIDVSEAAKLLEQLFANGSGVRLAPDIRTNSLLMSGPDEALNEMEEVLNTVDVPPTGTKKAADAKGKSVQMEMGPGGTMILSGSKDNVEAAEQMLSQMSSKQLADRSRELEDKASALTRDYAVGGESNKKDVEKLKRTVTEDFEVRQRLQLAEIEFLKARLDDLERRVRQKQKLKSLIIDRRIEALLSKPDKQNTDQKPRLRR